jgi:hypothetical protein
VRDLLQLLQCDICKSELRSMMSMNSSRVDSPASYGLQGLFHVPTLIEGIGVDVDLPISIRVVASDRHSPEHHTRHQPAEPDR